MKISSQSRRNPTLTEAYRTARDAFLRATGEPTGLMDALLDAHPEFLPAHLLRIAKLVAAKDASAWPALRTAITATEPFAGLANTLELALLAAARAWLAGDPLLAAELYTQVALAAPHDLLALRLAQSCWYFLGRRGRVRAIAEQVLPAWSPGARGYDLALAMYAFGCAETGDGERAEEHARRALDVEPRSPYAIHALVHALATLNRPADGARTLKDMATQWQVGGRMDSHNAWHLAVFELETGQPTRAVAALDRELLPAAAFGTGASADATDLLWRLDLVGIATGSRWQHLAERWVQHVSPGFWSFLDVLAGITYLRAGHRPRAMALMQKIASGHGKRAFGVAAHDTTTLQILAGIDAFIGGAFDRAYTALQTALPSIGGSLAQRDLFRLTLEVAEHRRASRDIAAPAAA
jgi:tetratricopeptide (TPR) repeat protein